MTGKNEFNQTVLTSCKVVLWSAGLGEALLAGSPEASQRSTLAVGSGEPHIVLVNHTLLYAVLSLVIQYELTS